MVGGALVEVASWHWIFLVNIPFGLLGIAAGAALVARDLGPDRRPQGGLLGMAPARRGVFCLTFALIEANPGLATSRSS